MIAARLALLGATTLAACSGPTDETPPPAEATLAFTMDSSIYVVSTKEGAIPALLDSGFIRPSWSPGGGTLAMVATGEPDDIDFPSNQALYLADADGGNVRQLAGFRYLIPEPALWSPDGSSLLFVRSRRIYPPTDSVIRVAATGGPEAPIDGVFLVGIGPVAVPSWSHDGSLVTLDLGGTFIVVDAVNRDTVLQVVGTSPRFSPVTDDIAFREPTTGHIHLIRPDSTADRDLQVDGYPKSWSPDGERFAFVGLVGGVYTVDTDGSHLSRIGPLDVNVGDLVWSADGQRIAYVVSTSFGPSSIYVARPEDSNARSIVTGSGVCCPSWRP
jgi:Tol biopolymer transport system component